LKFFRLVLTAALALSTALPVWAGESLPPARTGQKPFLWGVATASYQNDGPTEAMDWYSLEEKGLVTERSGKGPDFRGHADEDLDRAQSLGINAFRMSIEWARLEPEPGQWNMQEVAYLHKVFRGLKRRGMQPVVTLHHFISPRWIHRFGDGGPIAWEHPDTVAAFTRYVEFVAKEFGADIDYYLTFNEPSTLIGGGYTVGMLSPHHAGIVETYQATTNLLEAHKMAYEAIHRADPVAMVSMPDYHAFFPMPRGGMYYMPSQVLEMLLEKVPTWSGEKRVKHLDFVALHYYGSADAKTLSSFPPIPYAWGSYPEHLTKILQACYETFRLPIMVAENGMATKNNEPRPDGWTQESYLVAHVKAMQEAQRGGVPIMGYMYWTLTDNYEWGSFDPRFGLWAVECRTGDLTRRERKVAGVYREIIKHDGVTEALARRYPPPGTAEARAN
jgi:beta-glucosidase